MMATRRCRLCSGALCFDNLTEVYTCSDCGAQYTFFESDHSELGIHDIMIQSIRSNDILSVRNDLAHGVSANATTPVDTQSGTYHSSALHEAISVAHNFEIARLLIQFGADVNEVVHLPEEERSLLSCAILDADSPELVKLLLKHGADVRCGRILSDGTTISTVEDAQNRSIQALLQQYIA